MKNPEATTILTLTARVGESGATNRPTEGMATYPSTTSPRT
jgi:hypothetical protein